MFITPESDSSYNDTMTLRLKMGYQIGAMVFAIGLLGASALWGIRGLHHDLGSAVAGYEELRQLYEVGSHIRTAQTLLSLENPDRHQAMREVQSATTKIVLGPSAHHARQREDLKGELQKVQQELWPALVDNSEAVANANTSLNKTLRQISNLATEIRTRSQEKQAAADSKQRTTLILMSVICALTVAGAIIIGIFHYRS